MREISSVQRSTNDKLPSNAGPARGRSSVPSRAEAQNGSASAGERSLCSAACRCRFAALPGHRARSRRVTPRPLARELNRRGWSWQLNGQGASATKAYPPPGVDARTLTIRGPDRLTSLIVLLADVIRDDEERGLTLPPPYRADLVARAQNGRVTALVEIENPRELAAETATAFRRDLLADNRLDLAVPFFLMVSQDMGVLWQNDADPFAKPTIQFPLVQVVAQYWPWLDPAERLPELTLEPVMSRWLIDLALRAPDRPVDADRFFDGTNFLDAITAAAIDSGAPV